MWPTRQTVCPPPTQTVAPNCYCGYDIACAKLHWLWFMRWMPAGFCLTGDLHNKKLQCDMAVVPLPVLWWRQTVATFTLTHSVGSLSKMNDVLGLFPSFCWLAPSTICADLVLSGTSWHRNSLSPPVSSHTSAKQKDSQPSAVLHTLTKFRGGKKIPIQNFITDSYYRDSPNVHIQFLVVVILLF